MAERLWQAELVVATLPDSSFLIAGQRFGQGADSLMADRILRLKIELNIAPPVETIAQTFGLGPAEELTGKLVQAVRIGNMQDLSGGAFQDFGLSLRTKTERVALVFDQAYLDSGQSIKLGPSFVTGRELIPRLCAALRPMTAFDPKLKLTAALDIHLCRFLENRIDFY